MQACRLFFFFRTNRFDRRIHSRATPSTVGLAVGLGAQERHVPRAGADQGESEGRSEGGSQFGRSEVVGSG